MVGDREERDNQLNAGHRKFLVFEGHRDVTAGTEAADQRRSWWQLDVGSSTRWELRPHAWAKSAGRESGEQWARPEQHGTGRGEACDKRKEHTKDVICEAAWTIFKTILP